MKLDWILIFSRYDESFRLSRKLLDRSRPASIAAYRSLLEMKGHNLLTQILANPDDLEAHLYRFVAFL